MLGGHGMLLGRGVVEQGTESQLTVGGAMLWVLLYCLAEQDDGTLCMVRVCGGAVHVVPMDETHAWD